MKRLLLLLICLPSSLYAQNTIGLPDVVNYSKHVYGGGLQNWDIQQDNNGIIYVANNEGLLSYDGNTWHLYPLPNKTIVRSVEIDADGKIYVGGQDELGYFSPGIAGRLTYHSLTGLIPLKDKSFGDVWDIVSSDSNIFFRSPSKIFKLNKDGIITYNAPQEWSYMGLCNGRIYAHDFKTGLMCFDNNAWHPLFSHNSLSTTDPVTAIVPLGGDSSLLATLKSGLFYLSKAGISPLAGTNNDLFKNERIYAAAKVNPQWTALATTTNGVQIIDAVGNIIQSFGKTEGLQNSNVLSIFRDHQSNLWLGLDNGIDLVAYNSSIKQINPSPLGGSGYAAIIYENRLFIGTTNGLYSTALQQMKDLSFSKGDFDLVKNTKGQVWHLADIYNELLMGHHEGAFVIKDNVATSISSNPGFWNFVPLSDSNTASQFVSGYYKGLKFFNYTSGQFRESGEVANFDESSRFVAIDSENNIWVSHPYHGIYKITKGADNSFSVKKYTDKNGLPSALNNNIYKIKNAVLAATNKGIYAYNIAEDIFEPSSYYQKLLGTQSIRYLKEDPKGNIWFIHEKSLGVLDFSGTKPTIIYLPELNNKMLSGFEFIYPVNESNIFLGGEKGFFLINYEKYKEDEPKLQVQVRTVRIIDNKDSLLFGGYFASVNANQMQDVNKIPDIKNNWKTIHFEFSSSLFGYQSNLEYSYKLKGFEDNWSEWKDKTEKEYTNLAAGSYTFQVKVRNNLGRESGIATFAFKILPPWYQTTGAYLIYFLLFGLAIYTIYRILRKKFILQKEKHDEEQKRLSYIHELELNKTENELVALRNEKLEADINFKNSELASSAMHLVKKGELLSKIKSELNQVMKSLENPAAAAEVKKMIKSLSDDDNIDREWESFAKHFDKVHSDFVIGLKEKHPNVSANELKLCAYLRMNLSTKEIAQLMNISVRGVEISRYRLRKKLQVPTETGLFDYLISIQKIT
ncbi:transcriptional regulator [Ginsengibacter hankyongi]|uniref:Transcriptional regulator n=1 Tax=Ginsengibacter hankyongi TaxID=2607284 RepID=A0A5J5IDB0_9BACT|nr:triple tyrosine motif-containing protein [Ginsengibacter hankyongi]KAA9037602.1 transcriptional regulator [Ginsengibacter hankyongi]